MRFLLLSKLISFEQNACKNLNFYYILICLILILVIKNTHIQDYWLTDRNFKFWVRKSDDKTAFCSYCQKKIDVTNDGEGALKRHAGFASFEDKGKNHKLRTRVAGSWSLLGHLKKTESEEVTNDAVKKKIQLLTINPHNYQ